MTISRNTLYVLTAPPNSGKTMLSESFGNTVVREDEYRHAMYVGDKRTPGERALAQIREDIIKGDVTAELILFNSAARSAFLKSISDVDCVKKAVYISATLEEVLSRPNVKSFSGRPEILPYAVIKLIFNQFEPPSYSEGWDEIITIENHNKE